MTEKEEKAIESLKEDIKYAYLRDTVSDDLTVCFIDDLETVIQALEQKDKEIQELKNELKRIQVYSIKTKNY